ncbi:carboxypeptidase regulatory-like domain-containing protein [Candidatus Woesearchaeota archaeon]|nr:carboxypeptidase regulatory-like domain-containing protein [Candidatus Woesearchaeota archaeon]
MLLFNLLISYSPVEAQSLRGCCFKQTSSLFCKTVPDHITYEQCCPGGSCTPEQYDPDSPCDQTEICNQIGCCVDSCKTETHSDCPPPNGFVYYDEDSFSCSMIDIVPNPCTTGCCAYVAQNQVQDCRDSINRNNCIIVPPSPFDGTIFFPNEACVDVCDIGAPAATGNLTGHMFGPGNSVITATNREVRIADKAAIPSSSTGAFSIPRIPVGQHEVTAYAQGYAPVSSTVTISQNAAADVTLVLTIATDMGIVFGNVTDFETGMPVGATIFTEGLPNAYTGGNGQYVITNVQQGLKVFTATAPGYNSNVLQKMVIAGMQNQLDFQLVRTPSSELCGNSDIDDGEECDPTYLNGAPCEGYCIEGQCRCAQTCLDMLGQCCVFGYQCSGAGGEYYGLPLDCQNVQYQGSDFGCCDVPCEPIPPCLNGNATNLPVSRTNISGLSGPYCYCGDEYINVNTAAGYCCGANYQTQMCVAGGLFRGYVLNSSGSPIEEAYVKLYGSYEFSTYTNVEGYFTIGGVSPGEYDVVIKKHLFENINQSVNIISNQVTERNFTMVPVNTSCMFGIPPPQLGVHWTRGEELLEFTWNQSCPENVKEFYLFKDGLPLTRLTKEKRNYIDYDVHWDIPYSYFLVVFSHNMDVNESNRIGASPGDHQCEDMLEETEFCMDDIEEPQPGAELKYIRARCNEMNQMAAWNGTNFSSGGDCREMLGSNDAFCLELDNLTWCEMAFGYCENLGEYYNLFGLYYDLEYDSLTCEYNNSANPPEHMYCYYDVSQTSVDACMDCRMPHSCYDYRSEYACTTNNCVAGNGKGCEWAQFVDYFGELGKGICYEPGYDGNKCGLCGPDKPPFENTHCTPGVCSLLGKCYSNEDETQCYSCDSTKQCEQYSDRIACEGLGMQGFDVPDPVCRTSPENILSDDACGLGRCRWIIGTTGEGICVKDGNDLDGRDCVADDTPEGIACRDDQTPPATILTNMPMFIISTGTTLEFLPDVDSDKSFYCINGTGFPPCCPTNEIVMDCANSSDPSTCKTSISLPNLEYPLENFEGDIELRFYSIDKHKNVEDLNIKSIFVDTIIPAIDVTYTVINSSADEFTSNLSIGIEASEHVYCTDRLKKGSDVWQNLFITEVDIDEQYETVYPDMQDGTYTYFLNCSDDYGNIRAIEQILKIDRVHLIFDESPNNVTLPVQPEVRLFMKTYGEQDYCRYMQTAPQHGSWKNFNGGFAGLGISDGAGHYYYEETLYDLDSGTYEFDVECRDGENGLGSLLDVSNLIFTVDGLPPVTAVFMEENSYRNLLDESRFYKEPSVIFNCSDTDQGPPPEFGCAQTLFCYGESRCEPSTAYANPVFISQPSGDYTLCYQSFDLAGTAEEVICRSMKIDKTGPDVTVYEMPITRSTQQWVTGSFNDENIVDVWIKVEERHGVRSFFALAEINHDLMGFRKQAELFNGENIITATAIDAANNRGFDQAIVILDQEGPDFKTPEITDHRKKKIADSPTLGAEYGYPVNFSVFVFDTNYTHELRNITLIIRNRNSSDPPIDVSIPMAEINVTSGIMDEGMYSVVYMPAEHGLIPIGDYNATFYAEDRLGNANSVMRHFFVNDTLSALVNITHPLDQMLYSQEAMDVLGTYVEPSIDHLNVIVVGEKNLSSYTAAYDASSFNASVLLYPGPNLIQANAVDIFNNSGSDYVIILNDLIPPNISGMSITDTYNGNDPDSDSVLEYGFPLFFRTEAEDYKYTYNVTKVELRLMCQDLAGEPQVIVDTLYPDTPILTYGGGNVFNGTMYMLNETPYFSVYFDDEVHVSDMVLEDFCMNCVVSTTDDSMTYLVTPWKSDPVEPGFYSLLITARKLLANGSYGPFVDFSVPFGLVPYYPSDLNLSEGQSLVFTQRFDSGSVGDYTVLNTTQAPGQCSFDRTFDMVKTLEVGQYRNKTYYSFLYEPEIVGGRALLGSAWYNAVFRAYDQFGNMGEEYVLFRIIDSIPPKFNITVDSDFVNSLGQTKIGRNRDYYVNVLADKPLDSISLFQYSVFSPKTSSFTTKHLTPISGSGNNYTFAMRVYNNEYFDGLSGNNTEFLIKALSQDGIEGTEESIVDGRYFEIDTKAPDIILEPDLDGEVVYEAVEQRRITGITEPVEPNSFINLTMSVISGRIKRPSDIQHYSYGIHTAGLSLPVGASNLYGHHSEGSASIVVNNDVTSKFAEGNYLEFHDNNDAYKRLTYERYEIMDSSFDEGNQITTLFISPGLESGIPEGVLVKAYAEPYPTGWFEHYLDLFVGNNTIGMYAVDELGNLGKTLRRTIINDITPPEIYQVRPYGGSVINGKRLKLTAKIEDLFSPVKMSSIQLVLNNQTFGCQSGLKCRRIDDRKFDISYDPSRWVTDVYNATLIAYDVVGNLGVYNWMFEIDPDVPDNPEIVLLNGSQFRDVWYSDDVTPTFRVKFTNRTYASIERIVLVDELIGVVFSRIDDWTFYANPWKENQLYDSLYLMRIEAHEIFSDNEASRNGVYFQEFVVDTVAPEVYLDNIGRTNRIQNFGVDGDYYDYFMDENDRVLVHGDVESRNAALNGPFFRAITSFIEQFEQGTRRIFATAFDKAGNNRTASIDVEVDTVAPSVEITKIEPMDGSLVVVEGDSAEGGLVNYTLDYIPVRIKGIADLNTDLIVNITSPEGTVTYISEIVTNVSAAHAVFVLDNVLLPYSIDDLKTLHVVDAFSIDDAGNKGSHRANVILDKTGPIITFVAPRHSFDPAPRITVETDEPATCTLVYTPLSGAEKTVHMTASFSRKHYSQLEELPSNENKETPTQLKFICVDQFGYESVDYDYVVIDKKPPRIVGWDLSVNTKELVNDLPGEKYFIMFMYNETEMSVVGSEPVRCRYDRADVPFSEMRFDFMNFGAGFMAEDISRPFQMVDRTNNTFYISCEDQAGLVSGNKRLVIYLDIFYPIHIYDISPERYTNDLTPEISGITRRETVCGIERVDYSNVFAFIFDYVSKIFTGAGRMAASFRKDHYYHETLVSGDSSSPTQVSLEENATYSFRMTCSDPSGTFEPGSKTVTFTVDTKVDSPIIYSPQQGFVTNETLIYVEGAVERMSRINIYVNNLRQNPEPIPAEDGAFSYWAVLQHGSNEVKVEVIDKASNTASSFVTGVYNNIGPTVEYIDPDYSSILPYVEYISGKIYSDIGLDMQSAEVQLFRTGSAQPLSGQIVEMDDIRFRFVPDTPLDEGLYRLVVVPKNNLGSRGQGYLSIFEVDENSAQLFLRSPYEGEWPYRDLVITSPEVLLEGEFFSYYRLNDSKLYIDGKRSALSLVDNEFSVVKVLEQESKNTIKFFAEDRYDHQTMVVGHVFRDTKGPKLICIGFYCE